MRPAIRVDNLSKQYRIGTRQRSSDTQLREIIGDGAKGLWQRLRCRANSGAAPTATSDSEFWALKDISFEVQPGDVVGIIGGNGAGKSTLLKILSRIVEPTSGRAEVRGRIGSLLEVGTGFHPELTGRENIYLNGSILGMSRREITHKFDEIVAFSEIERFLDTPVKRYSSGMYVRLAFAVAAHLEPEILVVDEVLAVGDVQFQKKCLGKMRQVGQSGRTVLLVSHSMSSISALCNSGLFLENGQIVEWGSINTCIRRHLDSAMNCSPVWNGDEGDSILRLQELRLEQPGITSDAFVNHKPISVFIRYHLEEERDDLIIGVDVLSELGAVLAFSRIDDDEKALTYAKPGAHEIRLTIPANTLSQGNFGIRLDMGFHNIRRVIDRSLQFHIDNIAGIGRKFHIHKGLESVLRPCWEWNCSILSQG